MITVNNQNSIYPDYQLGKLTAGSQQITIRDLMKYAKQKSCGRLWMTIKWIFSGKGLITKDTASALLQRHPQRDKILEEFNVLKTLIKTQAVAQPIIEKKEPGVGQLSIAKTTEAKTTEQETPVATPKKIEEQKIEKNALTNDISYVKINPPKTHENELLEEYLRKGYSEAYIRQAIQVGMKVEEYAAMKNEDLEEARAQERVVMEKREEGNTVSFKEIPKSDPPQELKIENSTTSSPRLGEIRKITPNPLIANFALKHIQNQEVKREAEISSYPNTQESPKHDQQISENLQANTVKQTEMPPEIAVTSDEDMDLNEAYRIIEEALTTRNYGDAINDFTILLNANIANVCANLPPNLFLIERIKNDSRKGEALLQWILQYKEFPQLFEKLKILPSFSNICHAIEVEASGIANPQKKTVYMALRKACLAADENNSNVRLPSIDRLGHCRSFDLYTLLEDSLNTITNHHLHKSKYGSGLHEFLIVLNNNSSRLARKLGISISNPWELPGINLLRWALENKKMKELYASMEGIESLNRLRRRILNYPQIDDLKIRYIYALLHYLCGVNDRS